MLNLWVLVLGCGPAPALPRRAWVIRGDGVFGTLSGEGGCRVGLWGPGWGTPGVEPVACVAEAAEDGVWVSLPFEGGASEGEASLRVRPEAGSAWLPLGARPGEHALELRLEARAAGAAELTAAAAASEETRAALRTAWQSGAFRLQDGEELAGELRFRAGQPTRLGLYAASWMTDGLVDAQQLEDGPDLVLLFDAAPTFTDDPAILRINRPTATAVVPMGPTPSPAELRYTLVPGTVSSDARAEAQALATLAGGQRELTVGLQLVAALTEQANDVFFRAEGDACPTVGGLEGDWDALLVGYEVLIERVDLGCAVRVEPTRVQHGRRLAAQVGPDGRVVESVLRGL